MQHPDTTVRCRHPQFRLLVAVRRGITSSRSQPQPGFVRRLHSPTCHLNPHKPGSRADQHGPLSPVATSSTSTTTTSTEPRTTRPLGGTLASKPRSTTSPSRKQLPMEPPQAPSAQPLPADALPLSLKQRSLVTETAGVVLEALHPGVTLNTAHSKEGAAVFGLDAPSGATHMLDITLGKLATGRMLACARSKLWWMTPEWRTSTKRLPPEVQFLLVEVASPALGQEPSYVLLLPLIDGSFRATLRPAHPRDGKESELVLRVESGDPRVKADAWSSVLHVSAGTDPFALVDRGVAAAAKLSGGAAPLSSKKLPPSLDVFGWCTWDAFYSSVSAKGILDGLTRLHEHGIKPRFLIIDDGWQMTALDPPGMTRSPATPAELAEQITWLDENKRNILRETDAEFQLESMEKLAKTAVTLPQGTSAATSMPLLSSLGPEGARTAASQHHHSHSHHHTPGDSPVPSSSGAATQGASASQASASQASASQASGSTTSTLASLEVIKETHTSSSNNKAGASNSSSTAAVSGSSSGKPETAAEDAAWIVARVGQKMAGWVVGLGTAAILLAYQWLVDPAAPGSLPVRLFAALANGPGRATMIGFYSGASDFTRRLVSVKANSKFSSLEADSDEPWDGKPEDLKTVVAALKDRFGLNYVYCWHGLPGYWAGIMPDAPEMASYGGAIMYALPTAGVLEVEPSMAWNPAVLAGVGVVTDPTPVYQAMHSYLSSAGIDGVKVDCQAGLGLVGSALGGGPALSKVFHEALEDSIAAHFSHNHAINCMCHSTENLYRMRDTAIARASDDFYPRDPASSQPHIAACAYNSLFMSALVQPDWDMFHSKHPAARLHAIARAISGGGVYVSDKPGEHDAALLKQLVLPDGSLLRCGAPGRPTRDSLFVDPLRDGKSLLKVWNINTGGPGSPPDALPLNGVVAAFNLQGSSWDRDRRKFFVHDTTPPALEGQVRPCDVDAFRRLPSATTTTYVAYVNSRPLPTCLHTLTWMQPLKVNLPSAQADIVTIAPVHQSDSGVQFAVLGLSNMMNSGGAVTGITVNTATNSGSSGMTTATVDVRGTGSLLMYTTTKPRSVSVCGIRMLLSWQQSNGALSVEVPAIEDLTSRVVVQW